MIRFLPVFLPLLLSACGTADDPSPLFGFSGKGECKNCSNEVVTAPSDCRVWRFHGKTEASDLRLYLGIDLRCVDSRCSEFIGLRGSIVTLAGGRFEIEVDWAKFRVERMAEIDATLQRWETTCGANVDGEKPLSCITLAESLSMALTEREAWEKGTYGLILVVRGAEWKRFSPDGTCERELDISVVEGKKVLTLH